MIASRWARLNCFFKEELTLSKFGLRKANKTAGANKNRYMEGCTIYHIWKDLYLDLYLESYMCQGYSPSSVVSSRSCLLKKHDVCRMLCAFSAPVPS